MIKLKLAQYSKEGKFEKFLELGKDFLYGGDFIRFFHGVDPLAMYAEPCAFCDIQRGMILKDEKDPFNRFDGFFHGRTYGNGRFILVNGGQDNIYENYRYSFVTEKLRGKGYAGNIHENPELWAKLKEL